MKAITAIVVALTVMLSGCKSFNPCPDRGLFNWIANDFDPASATTQPANEQNPNIKDMNSGITVAEWDF